VKKQLLLLICISWLISGFDLNRPNPFPFSYQVKKVVIDAGHGGKDPGCHGVGSKEKHITLGIALKLGRYIERNFEDVEVIYTRTTDKYIELKERANIANRNNADLFISVHCNAQPNGHSAHGTETYVMGLHKSDANLNVAKRENSVTLLEDNYEQSYDGFDPNAPESHIIFTLYQNAFLEQSIRFASLCEKQFVERAKRKSRGVKQAGFVVLYKTAMPSVLVESGYLTNRAEEKYLMQEEGQSYIASAMFRAFKEYKEEVEGKSIGTNIIEDQIIENRPPPIVEEVKEEPKPKPKPKTKPKAKNTSTASTTKPKPKTTPKTTPKPKTETAKADKNHNYRVQLYTSYDDFDLVAARFDQLSTVEIESNNRGVKKYLILDEYKRRKEAEAALKTVKKAGFIFAKIVEYSGTKRLSD